MSNLEMWTNQEQQMEQRPAATLVAFAALLALPSWELEQTMHQELASNPALELAEADVCPRCGNPRNDGICYFCLDEERFDYEGERQRSTEMVPLDEDFDLLSIVPAPRSLPEDLTELTHIALTKDAQSTPNSLKARLNKNGQSTIPSV